MEYLTIKEITTELKVSDETVYRWIRAGKLKAVRAGGNWRVERAELDRFLKS